MDRFYSILGVIIMINTKKLKVGKYTKMIAYILSMLLMVGSDFEYGIYSVKKLYRAVVIDYIKPTEEFILFKCKTDDHKSEKVYISVNDIYKDKNKDIIVDVNLRYKGKNSLKLYGNDGFDELSGFSLEAAGIKNQKNSSGTYISLSSDKVREYNPHISNLDTTVSNGDVINIKAPMLIEGTKVENFDIDDLKFKIDKSYSGTHHGVGSFQYVRLEK